MEDDLDNDDDDEDEDDDQDEEEEEGEERSPVKHRSSKEIGNICLSYIASGTYSIYLKAIHSNHGYTVNMRNLDAQNLESFENRT